MVKMLFGIKIMIRHYGRHKITKSSFIFRDRLIMLVIFFLFFGVVILGQLFRIQVLQHKVYAAKASKQYKISPF